MLPWVSLPFSFQELKNREEHPNVAILHKVFFWGGFVFGGGLGGGLGLVVVWGVFFFGVCWGCGGGGVWGGGFFLWVPHPKGKEEKGQRGVEEKRPHLYIMIATVRSYPRHSFPRGPVGESDQKPEKGGYITRNNRLRGNSSSALQ